MNALDSPMEALTFNYLSFSFFATLNNLWTWLAALSFWKIRAAGCPNPELLPPSHERTSHGPDPVPDMLEPDAVSGPAYVPTVVANGVADVDGVTKGKFTVYYEDDRECESDDMLTVTEEWEGREGRSGGSESEWWKSWERLLRLRIGENENGWYTWQDLTVINGNVVRLWDGGFSSGAFTRDSRDSLTSCVHVW